VVGFISLAHIDHSYCGSTVMRRAILCRCRIDGGGTCPITTPAGDAKKVKKLVNNLQKQLINKQITTQIRKKSNLTAPL
jgi:hypothetical protein